MNYGVARGANLGAIAGDGRSSAATGIRLGSESAWMPAETAPLKSPHVWLHQSHTSSGALMNLPRVCDTATGNSTFGNRYGAMVPVPAGLSGKVAQVDDC